MSTQKASKALLSRLAETVIEEFKRDDLYVSQVPPGVFLGREHFEVLQKLASDRLDDPESVARLVEMSRLVDCVQVDEETITTPEDTPGFLSDRFAQVVNNVKFTRAPLGEAEQRRYDQARALLYEDDEVAPLKREEYADFCLLRSDLEKKEVVLMEMRLNLKKTNSPEEKSVLSSEITAFENLVRELRESLDALDRVYDFREAEEIIDAAEREVDQIPTAVRDMIDSIELLRISDPISHATHVGGNFSPSHLAEDNWIPLKLTGDDIAKWQSNGAGTASTETGLDDNEIDTITLEVQTVTCYRPWMWSALFENRYWGWEIPSQPVSDGALDGKTNCLIPGYIFGLVLARNVVIKGKPSAQKQFEKAKLKPLVTADLLTYAITPTATLAAKPAKPVKTLDVKPAVSTLQPLSTSSLRVKSAIATGKVAPLISRSSIQPALAQPAKLKLADATMLKQPHLHQVKQPDKRLISNNLLKHRIDLLQKELLMIPARGRVVGPQGQGLYQAVVTIQTPNGERRVHTGQDGHFSAQLAQGRYTVRVDKPGFRSANGSISIPQKEAPPIITLYPLAKEQLKICLVEQVSGKRRPFSGSAKVTIEGNRTQQVETLNSRSETTVSLQPGKYMVTAMSETAAKILPAKQAVEIRSQSNSSLSETRVEFTVYSAPQLSNPEIQLLGFIGKRVPPCPTRSA
jgi:hypothetical protein